MFLTKPPPKPELQHIREEGLKGTEKNQKYIKDVVERLKPKTSRAHAAWLFYGEEKALQKIMRLMDGCRSSTLYPGWKDFAHVLGVPREVINPIDCRSFGEEGYTYYVLLHYAQLENATIHNILNALLELSRYDVVTETHKLLEGVADYAISFENEPSNELERTRANSVMRNEEDSGYYSSISSENHLDEEVIVTECSLIKPPNVRKVPLMLKHINENKNIISMTNHALPPIRVQEEHNQTAAAIETPTSRTIEGGNAQKKKKYICIVLLTFANDGISYAKEVAKILRKERGSGQNIGVLMLNEHADKLEKNPYQFITGIFPQVHYVIPIITEGYIQAASSTTLQHLNEASYEDCKYVRFIYDLMLKHYADNGCLNKKTRCIIPDAFVSLIFRTFMKQPLFSAWERFSSTDALGERWVKRFSHV